MASEHRLGVMAADTEVKTALEQVLSAEEMGLLKLEEFDRDGGWFAKDVQLTLITWTPPAAGKGADLLTVKMNSALAARFGKDKIVDPDAPSAT